MRAGIQEHNTCIYHFMYFIFLGTEYLLSRWIVMVERIFSDSLLQPTVQ